VRNFLHTLHGFLSVTETETVSVREVQRLASWASRYGLVCRALCPFTMDLFSARRGYTDIETRLTLPAAARRAIMLWRCALVTLGCDPLRFACPLHTLAEKPPSLQIEYDASLTARHWHHSVSLRHGRDTVDWRCQTSYSRRSGRRLRLPEFR